MKNLSGYHRLNHIGTIKTVHAVGPHYSFLLLKYLDIGLSNAREMNVLSQLWAY